MKIRLIILLAEVFFLSACAPPAPLPERAIHEVITVKASVEEVWNAWTTTDGIKTFFAPDAEVELRVDGPFWIYMNPYAAAGMKGADEMRIIGFQDKKMLSFTWNAPSNQVTELRVGVLASPMTRGSPLTTKTTSNRFSIDPA